MAARKRASAQKIYELVVELEDVTPLVWRRLLVPGSITLPELHDLLQLVMGWTDSHLHSFTFGETTYCNAHAGNLEDLAMVSEAKQTLEAALGARGREFRYLYDFGDCWRCRAAVKPLAHPNSEWGYPVCTGGARAVPPDDVGGTGGYEDFLAAIGDPEHEDHEALLGWAGGAFDPDGFDLNAINRYLRFGFPPRRFKRWVLAGHDG